MAYSLPNITCLIQPLVQGGVGVSEEPVKFITHSLYGKENPNRENIVKAWEDHTTEGATAVIEMAIKAIEPKPIHLLEKTVSRCE